jgi:hypothetical protein
MSEAVWQSNMLKLNFQMAQYTIDFSEQNILIFWRGARRTIGGCLCTILFLLERELSLDVDGAQHSTVLFKLVHVVLGPHRSDVGQRPFALRPHVVQPTRADFWIDTHSQRRVADAIISSLGLSPRQQSQTGNLHFHLLHKTILQTGWFPPFACTRPPKQRAIQLRMSQPTRPQGLGIVAKSQLDVCGPR